MTTHLRYSNAATKSEVLRSKTGAHDRSHFFAETSGVARLLPALFLGVCTLLQCTNVRADFQIERWELQTAPASKGTVESSFEFLTSDTNYSADGSAFTPTYLKKATRMVWDTQFNYGLTPRLTGFARLSWMRASLDHPTLGDSRFGLGDQALGLNYKLIGQMADQLAGPRLYFQAQVEFPLYNNADALNDNTPFVGNQTTDITGGAFLELPLGDTSEREAALVFGLGFSKRSKSFANQLPYSAELRVSRPKTEGLIGRVGIYGTLPMGDDPLQGLALSNQVTLGSGGSFLTGSTTPALASIHGVAGYQFNSDWAINGEFGMTLFGKSAQKDMRFGAGIAYRFGGSSHPPDAEVYADPEEPRARGRADGFVGYNDAFEAKVVKVNDRMNLVKIDKGSTDGVAPGQLFDLFNLDKSGAANRPVARARVEGVRPGEAALRIQTYFKEVSIEEGFIAKRPLNTATPH